MGSVKAGKSFSGIVLSWNFAFFTTDFIVSFWSFCSISTSPAGRDERIPANLSQKTVVEPSSIMFTGIFVSKLTFISVAFIVRLPSLTDSNTFERIVKAVFVAIIS